jgi:hypothetical protein
LLWNQWYENLGQPAADGTKNATHGSDSQQSAQREIAFHFPENWQHLDSKAASHDGFEKVPLLVNVRVPYNCSCGCQGTVLLQCASCTAMLATVSHNSSQKPFDIGHIHTTPAYSTIKPACWYTSGHLRMPSHRDNQINRCAYTELLKFVDCPDSLSAPTDIIGMQVYSKGLTTCVGAEGHHSEPA